MTARVFLMAIVLALSAPVPLRPALAQAGSAMVNPIGTWLTESGHGVIRIAPCADGLCGTIVGIDRGPDEPMPKDVTGRPQCGLTFLVASADAKDGINAARITDPRDGRTYSAQLWVDGAGRLHLRGYIGIPLFGQTQIWRPFAGHIGDACRFTRAQS